MTNGDPSRKPGRWDGLFDVLRRIDGEIEQLYRRHGHEHMRARFALPLLRVAHDGPATIKELARASGQSHSALSQTIDAMRRAGLVQTLPGADARTRVVDLLPAGRALVPLVEREWRATEAAVAELDAALSISLASIADELETALGTRSIRARLDAHFQALEPAQSS